MPNHHRSRRERTSGDIEPRREGRRGDIEPMREGRGGVDGRDSNIIENIDRFRHTGVAVYTRELADASHLLLRQQASLERRLGEEQTRERANHKAAEKTLKETYDLELEKKEAVHSEEISKQHRKFQKESRALEREQTGVNLYQEREWKRLYRNYSNHPPQEIVNEINARHAQKMNDFGYRKAVMEADHVQRRSDLYTRQGQEYDALLESQDKELRSLKAQHEAQMTNLTNGYSDQTTTLQNNYARRFQSISYVNQFSAERAGQPVQTYDDGQQGYYSLSDSGDDNY